MRSARFALSFLCLFPLVACDGGSVVDDAGGDAGTTASIAAPSWGACPSGWEPLDVEGASVCTPPARVECTGATFQPIDSTACVPVDDACGTGAFREERDAGRSWVFVDAAASGGDGSEARPFTTLEDALGAGATGILLAAGDYTIVSSLLPADLEVRGVCPDRSRIVAPAGGLAAVVGPGARLALTGVTVTGTGLGLAARGTIALDRVVIEPGLESFGVTLMGGTLSARRTVIRGPVPSVRLPASSGIYGEAGSTVTLTDVVVDGAEGEGILLDASTLTGERVVIQHVDPQPDGQLGGGLAVVNGSTATVTDLYVLDTHDHGITSDSGGSFELTHVVVDDVATAPAESNGRGLSVWNGMGVVRSLLVRRSTATGASVRAGGTLLISDAVIQAIQPLEGFGSGLAIEEGSLAVERGLILDATFFGAINRSGTLTATDLRIERVIESRGSGGGVACSDGGTCSLTRFSLGELVTYGAVAVGDGSTLSLETGSIRDVRASSTYGIGRGIEVHSGGGGTVRDVSIDGVVETGIVAFALDEMGFLHDTRLSLTDVRVSGIAERPCVSTTCPTEGGGTGIASLASASVMAERTTVTGAPLCGVQVFGEAMLDVQDGTLARNAIGACVQIAGYDLSRIVGTTRFEENGRNVETTSAYVPERGPSF